MTDTTWQRIEEARRRWDVLRHPFYRRWSAGSLSRADLAAYSGQYRHAVETIATLSESVAEALPDRPGLRRHALEERDHVELWDRFVAAVGGDPADAPTPETAGCVRAWQGAEGLLDSLATLYAIESGQPAISRIKHRGLVERYGVPDGAATAYFSVHARLDRTHAAQGRALIEELGGDHDGDRLAAVAEGAFRANWRLLDGV